MPSGYFRAERQGVTFYFRAQDQSFVDEILQVILETRAKLAPLVTRLKDALQQARAHQSLLSPQLLDKEIGERLLQSIAALIDPSDADMLAMRDLWKSFVDCQPQVYERTLASLLRFVSLDNIRIVAAAEIVDGLLPVASYDNKASKVKFTLRVEGTSDGDWSLCGPANRKYAISEFNLAFPIHRDAMPNKATWRATVERLFSVADGLDNNKARLGNGFQLIPKNAAEAAFMPLHEAAEVGILRTFKISEPLARWFHDGMANYLAHEAIRQVLGEETYHQLPYSSFSEAEFSSAKQAVSLLAWPRADLEKYGATPESSAHYFHATEEIRGLADRHGREFIRKLLQALKGQRPVDTDMICSVVKSLTGDDLLSRLQAYAPGLPGPVAELEGKVDELLEAGSFEDALPLLRALVLHSPRNSKRRYELSMAYLNVDAEKYLREFLFHYLVHASLERSRGAEPEDPYLIENQVTASQFHALGRLSEEQGNLEGAWTNYEKALELNPVHESSLERLGSLQATAGN